MNPVDILILNVGLFLFLIPRLAKFLKKIAPEKEHKEAPHLTKLDSFFFETPVIGIEQSRVELLRMGDGVDKMMKHLKTILSKEEPDDALVQKVFHREEVMDIMQKEIVTFLAHLLSAQHISSHQRTGRPQYVSGSVSGEAYLFCW